jgi:hypothetical protein
VTLFPLRETNQQCLKFQDYRPKLQSFGDQQLDIAGHEGFFGCITAPRPSYLRSVSISGALLALIQDSKLTGLTVRDKRCYHCKGESAFDVEPRAFAVPPRPSVSNRRATQMVSKRVRNLPWGHLSDGFVYLFLTTPDIVMCDPMTMDAGSALPIRISRFKHGIYRFPISAIRSVAESRRAVSTDSASLVFCDAAFFTDLANAFDWEESIKKRKGRWSYFEKIAESIGTRFAFCEADADSSQDFQGDGGYTLDAKRIEFVDN